MLAECLEIGENTLFDPSCLMGCPTTF